MITHPFDFLRLPTSLLILFDSRTYHFWFQPIHYLVRLLHILSVSGFFGMELLFTLALLQQMERRSLITLSRFMTRPLHMSYAIAMITGVALFFFDPVHTGSKGYFTPKLIALLITGIFAFYGHRSIYWPVLTGKTQDISIWCRVFCVAECTVWVAVIVFSCLNTEGVPKIFLRHYL